MKSNLNLPICKLNLAIFLILAFKLYNHYIISISILLISLLDIILFSGIKIKGRDKIKFIQVIALYLTLSCTTIIITKEEISSTIFFLLFAIIIGEISVVEYKTIKGRD